MAAVWTDHTTTPQSQVDLYEDIARQWKERAEEWRASKLSTPEDIASGIAYAEAQAAHFQGEADEIRRVYLSS